MLHEVLESKNEGVTCSCGMTFCFRCGVETDHRPNSCRVFAEWTKKQGGGDTSLNDQLIATISRQCPKCNTSIQKNGGCNHMKCTFCSYHFCWQCMAKFGSGPKGERSGKGLSFARWAKRMCKQVVRMGTIRIDAIVLTKMTRVFLFKRKSWQGSTGTETDTIITLARLLWS